MSTAASACPKCGAPSNSVPASTPVKKKSKIVTFLKVIGGIWLAIVVIGIIAGSTHSSTKSDSPIAPDAPAPAIEHATAEQKESTITVDSSTLSAEYKANEVAADLKYKGKRLTVTGTVASINKDFTDSVWVGLSTDNEFMPIHAEGFRPSQVAELKKGDRIQITCTGAGMFVGDPFLKNCS